ncbi:ABC transporter ATP-binding protein [Amnibacterium sp. CER49]|uniref:ABC transporter ATP-binding protein n=1 Tax=Amnibacterium sp. CER49 TaxID=3039161 RepID=UPI00244C7FD9|nr:ABC transporter ATP-binding protein [Amnibacterium sp. CER49]MDH2444496.1 ABC transporter ATP-binding protein [Amnibacterium sp. CER49]
MTAPDLVLAVDGLTVGIGRTGIVQGVSLAAHRGQTLGIVGESGSGKSMTVLAATGLLDAPGAVVGGSSRFTDGGREPAQLVGAPPRLLRSVHGGGIGFVFQDPGTSLNPVLTIDRQLTESIEAHLGMTRRAATRRALELLEAVGIPDPEARLGGYPHQLSGGQRQRVMIAIALSCDPALLIADEPTTALDVTTQAQIIDLVQALQRDRGTAVVWISHDLGVIGRVADDVLVLRSGREVEHAPVDELFQQPQDPYTRRLLAARPRIRPVDELPEPAPATGEPVLRVQGLDVRFPVQTAAGRTVVHAVDDVSFEVRRGRTLGIVGESGSGKSTIARALTGLVRPDAGTATLGGADLFARHGRVPRSLRRRIAMVFQDPFASLNARSRIGTSIGEALPGLGRTSGGRRRVEELLDLVGLDPAYASRFPHELSGGQRQRVSIARALALEPELMILDEATASLDVSIQATVLDLLARLQRELGLTYLFIAHDLAIVQQMSHDVLVLQRGRTVEHRPAVELFAAPREQYTRDLLAAVPPERPAALTGH